MKNSCIRPSVLALGAALLVASAEAAPAGAGAVDQPAGGVPSPGYAQHCGIAVAAEGAGMPATGAPSRGEAEAPTGSHLLSVANISPKNSWNRAGLLAFMTPDAQQALYPQNSSQVCVRQLGPQEARDYGFQRAALVRLEVLNAPARPIEDSDNWTRFAYLIFGTDTTGRQSLLIWSPKFQDRLSLGQSATYTYDSGGEADWLYQRWPLTIRLRAVHEVSPDQFLAELSINSDWRTPAAD